MDAFMGELILQMINVEVALAEVYQPIIRTHHPWHLKTVSGLRVRALSLMILPLSSAP